MAYVAIAIFGAGMAHTVVNSLGGGGTILRALSGWDIWMIVAGAIGADVALYASRDKFGHSTRAALFGALVTTLIAAVVAGTLALPGYGTMFGPFATVMTFIGSPLLFVFWCIMLLAVHLAHVRWRRERETIFAGPADDGLPA